MTQKKTVSEICEELGSAVYQRQWHLTVANSLQVSIDSLIKLLGELEIEQSKAKRNDQNK